MAKAPATSESKTVEFTLPHGRETKGTHMYESEINGRKISFYVPKAEIPEGVKPDSTLKLTLNWV